MYIALLVRDDTGGASQIPFVVRNDAGHSDILLQTSDTTWEAYNDYGGNSLYSCSVSCPPGNPRAYKGADKVSYNRPFNFTADAGRANPYYAEYPMIRFMEANGYDVSYTSGADVDASGPLLLNHKLFISSGHDEYWSGGQRANVQAARDHGVNLAFFSGNEMFWKTRWEPSIDGSNTSYRTLVTYKETHYDAPTDPQDPSTWTGTWEDPRFSPPADGGLPPNALTGQNFLVNSGTADIVVPSQYGKLRIWRGTAAASLSSGQSLDLGNGAGTLGYEWDEESDNGFRPSGLFDLSSTTVTNVQPFTDYGSSTGTGSATHHLSLYRAPSGALVFGSGTVQWSWGLDADNNSGKPVDRNMQQATVNLLSDMGAQPASLLSGLSPATASTDTAPPTSTITSPAADSNLQDGASVMIAGNASDSGGNVAGVEVSTDGGSTWHPATLTTPVSPSVTWSYTWIVHGSPKTTIMSRAVDDSGNLETPTAGESVNVACSCSLWGTNVIPSTPDSADTQAIEVGVKFKSDVYGAVTGIRFYKASTNTGSHIGNLWTLSGQLLARATFTGESTSGWQTVTFSNPVLINPNTTYVASYFAPKGHYASTEDYFYPPPSPPPDGGGTVDAHPLHALRNTGSTTDGVYTYSGSTAFPSSTFQAENYWVDVTFAPQAAAGQVTGVSATAGYAGATLTWNAPATGGAVTSYTITPYIDSVAQPPTTVTGQAGSAAPTSATVTGLTNGTTYTFTVTASNPAGDGPPSTPSNAVTPLASLLVVQNGGFETGLSGWTANGILPPVATGTKTHSGSGAALLGTLSGTVPAGDSSLSQSISVPKGTSTLTFWYWPITADTLCSGSGCIYDWEEAQIRSTAGATLASVFKTNSNAQAWTQVSFDMTPYAGQTVVLWFNVHQDGSIPPDDTASYLDDVAVNGSGPTVPSAPTNVTGTAGNGSATVNWAAPSDGGSAITSYTITPHVGTQTQPTTTITGSPPATGTTITGLTNGTSYTFTVTASNAIGTGPTSVASNAVTPTAPTAPAAPTGVTATAANGSANVSWTAPSNGGSPIISYTVTPYIGSQAQFAATITGSPPATGTTITGLTNGTSYTFTVTASNAIGTGPTSVASNAVTPTAPTAPAAPTGVTATAANGSANVSWTAPSNGGSPITSYTVTPYIGSQAQFPATITGSPPATGTTITGLTNGTSYTFTVTASNAIGTGPTSVASNAVTPTAAPTPTLIQQVTARKNGTSVAVVPTAIITGGNRIVVLVGVWSAGNASAKTVTDAAGNTYSELQHFKASENTELSVWSAPVTAGGGTKPTITVTPTAKADVGVAALEYSGLSTAAGAAAVDQLAQASGTTSTAATVSSAATPATTDGGELAMGFYVDSGFGDTLTVGSGWTGRVNVSKTSDMELLVEDQPAAQGGTPKASAGTGASTVWLMSTIVFKHG